MNSYAEFIERKTQLGGNFGFEPIELPSCLFDFQAALVAWAIRKGRAAIFADCGLGKSLMQLVWADNVVRKTNKPVLILTPIAVGIQTLAEAEKFGIPNAVRSRDGNVPAGARIIITNYEQLQHFKAEDFKDGGVVCDESSILKNFKGARKTQVTAFMLKCKHRLLCTATAAPNDFPELGTSSEALGELGYMDMISRFFKVNNGSNTPYHAGHPRRMSTEPYRFRGYAENDFWRWVCSWARACRKPSDLGFDDAKFILPPIKFNEFLVSPRQSRPCFLPGMELPAVGLKEQREENSRTIQERCELAADIANKDKGQVVLWCHLDKEGNLLEKLVKGGIQVSGRDSDEEKESKLADFAKGNVKDITIKPRIGGFGLNWQNSAHHTFFPSHSYEQFYQCSRRSYRFGQTKPVNMDMISSPALAGVMENMQQKSIKADRIFSELVRLMNDGLAIAKDHSHNTSLEGVPWLK